MKSMPDYEARIKTKVGGLVVHFNDKAELEKRLENAAELIQTIESKTSAFAVVEERFLPGLEGICSVTSEGLPRLIVYPESDSDKLRIALYASHNPLSIDEIVKVTGVYNPTSFRVMGSDEVIETSGKYTLSGKGRTVVSSKLIPKLRKKL